MSLFQSLLRPVRVPLLGAILIPLLLVLVGLWALAVAFDRNPLPFPDRHYHVHSAASPTALAILEELMREHGNPPRFRADSPEVQRTLFANGTIINLPDRGMLQRLGNPGAALGLVVDDPDASARAIAARLQALGFASESIHDAEPGLPIAFVRTDALLGSIIVLRKHALRMGRRPDPWTPRQPPGR